MSGDARIDKWSAGASGEDPAGAIAKSLERCKQAAKGDCQLFAVNNVVVGGRDWKSAMPAALSTIGRLRPQPWFQNRGPQAAAGLLVWGHGYKEGADNTSSAAYPYVGPFLAAGYDLYRFDRKWIRDRWSDAKEYAESVRQAKAMGYRRVVLAGQSNGGWQALASTMRGAPADGVIVTAPAVNSETLALRDLSVYRNDFEQIFNGIAAGPRIVLINFANDEIDIGGKADMARSAFAKSGVQATIIDRPAGYSGHGAARDSRFARDYARCIHDFIEAGARAAPCG